MTHQRIGPYSKVLGLVSANGAVQMLTKTAENVALSWEVTPSGVLWYVECDVPDGHGLWYFSDS